MPLSYQASRDRLGWSNNVTNSKRALEEKPQRSETSQTRLEFDDQGETEKNNKDGGEMP